MKPTHVLLTIVVAAGIAAALVFWFSPAGFQSANQAMTLTVPPGFQVERAAGPPLVDRPIVADFDEQGRLYVAESSGSNDKVEKQLQEKPHRILRLEDTDGDGRFDKRTVFADRMMFPEGTLWFDGSLYVSAPPSIWKLTDTDGDGVADRREEWFQGKTLTGCANDLHGPYLGPDGWIYWCKGAFAEQKYELPGKPPFVTRAAHIFRRRPGESLVEPVMTGGMDNPVDVDFMPTGEQILTATFLEHPQLGRRDALIHAVYGGVYGKQHDVIERHKKTGDLLPALTHYGPAAPCGLTHYASRVFGAAYQDNFFACLFNLHKVTRHVLEPSGATFNTRDSDFLVSSSLDFHPTDVLEDADGSLVVIDTGAWYKLCCPTSQLAKPDVLGAIYRVRRKEAPKLDDPRGLQLVWAAMKPADLTQLLDDTRPAVRKRAIGQLAKLGNGAIAALESALKTSGSAEARRNAVWALTRIEGAAARQAVHDALKDQDDTVRHAAIHSAGVWRDAGALPHLLDALSGPSPQLQRAAAEALGRTGDKSAVPGLLAAAGAPHDRVLEHSLTYAVIEIADPAATAQGLRASSPDTRRAALMALDQMDGGGLKPEQVTPLLTSSEPPLKQTAWWIAERHPEWGGALAGFFRRRLDARNLTSVEREEVGGQLARFGSDPQIQDLLAATVARARAKESRLVALRVMEKARVKEMPPVWIPALVLVLEGKDPDLIREAVAAARASAVPKERAAELTDALQRVARESAAPAEVRLEALAAIPGGINSVDAELLDLLRASIAPTQTVGARGFAASVLEKAKLSRDQLLMLADSLKTAGPLELSRVLAAFDNGSDEEVGLKMIAALGQSKALSSLRADVLRPRLEKYPQPVKKQGEALLAKLNLDAARQSARLEELLASLEGGDIRRGQAVFNSQKAACSSCHAIGYLGGKVGPDLTKIGQIRAPRDLLEAIIYPSASFVRSYEPLMVITKSGERQSGVVREDAPDEVVLATSATEEVRIPRSEIAEMRPGTVSVMPSGLDEQLTRQELADLLAFLKATRREAQ